VAPLRDQGLAGLTSPDWQIVDAHHVRLRAERSIRGDGRVYTIRITAADAAGEESRIAFERGRYVIDLRSTDIGPALAMLAQATNATVRGAEVLSRQPTQLSRSAVVATPAEAWQAVLGDVANFAISCAAKGCTVFVTAVAKGDARGDAGPSTLALAAPLFAPANAGNGAEMPAVDPVAAAAAIAAAKSANGMLPPGAVPPPENGESEN